MPIITLSTGSEDLNSFLHGYPIKGIAVIYGEPATGKTTMAFLAAITQIKNNKKVIYVDTEGSFSIERMQQLCPEINNYMQNLIKIHPTSFEEQSKILNTLPTKNIALIIIDTISFYYRINSKENLKETNEILIQQLDYLKQLSENNKIPIIIANQVYQSFNNTGTKIVAGDILKHRASLLIKLIKTPRTLFVEYPEKTPNQFLFEIKNEGIFKIGE